MLETADGSDDGLSVRAYRAGETYSVSVALGRAFIDMGVARRASEFPHRETKPDGPTETPEEPAVETPEDPHDRVEMAPTKDGSPYYQFWVDGELLVDGDGTTVKILGRDAAESKKDELIEALRDVDTETDPPDSSG